MPFSHDNLPQDAIEPINRNKIRKPIHQKMKHFFGLVLSELYFSFFHVANQFLFWWFNSDYTLELLANNAQFYLVLLQ